MTIRRTLESLDDHKRELVVTLDRLFDAKEQNSGLIRNLLVEMHYADIADILDVMEPEHAARVLDLLDSEEASDVLGEMEEVARTPLMELVPPHDLAELLEEMPTDDAADLVGDLDEATAEEVLSHIAEEERQEIRELLLYDEDTAGGLMESDFIAVRQDATVNMAVEAIRRAAEEVESIYYVYVVDEQGNLTGLLRLRDLLLSPGIRRVDEFMETDITSVPLNMDQEDVARLVQQYDLAAIPVVDDTGRLMGRITHDDIVDVLEEEIEEDLRRMAGVGDEDIIERSPLRVAASRLPWIMIGLVSALVAGFIIENHEHMLQEYLVLASFIPVVMAIGGSIGVQSSTIVVRGLATGQADLIHLGSRLFKELRIGLVMGLICGLTVGSIAWLWQGAWQLGVVLGLSMLMAILVAATLGAAVPVILDRLRVDPALAAGPFMTMSNDIVGLLIYFGLASNLLRWFQFSVT
ncbi:magnesium transporter [Gemmatimonadota bacterium]